MIITTGLNNLYRSRFIIISVEFLLPVINEEKKVYYTSICIAKQILIVKVGRKRGTD